ncbi:hypothetical protein HRbin02_00167 [Candidatus Calditenuaceae archaeon HR02]|nr:hypothetical protein HRbin02_00167 [Candidatus Calditenuaceae archaeon HR02]
MKDMQDNSPWITDYIKLLVEKYFGPCGLVKDALKELRNLPKSLSRRLGCDVQTWQEYLSDLSKAPTRLNLIEGAVKFVGEKALRDSEKYGKDLRYYLNRALDEEHMTNFISRFIEEMGITERR